PYPFAKGFGVLPKEEVSECLVGFFQRRPVQFAPYPENLREWFLRAYGHGISQRNLICYTEKAWKTPCDKLSLDFVSRVQPPSQDDIVKAALGIEVESPISHLEFRYPKEGGFEALVRAMHDHDHRNVTVNWPVDEIRWDGEFW